MSIYGTLTDESTSNKNPKNNIAMDSPKFQLADKLKTANNILVTVSRNPSVDQLAACIGLTLLLNKQGKHAAAVFSGSVPSTIEFLEPEETLEKNTDSLRDFIIALDKSKADKLRYKVEDNVVRIFITPYKTSISEADLEFSQGDFNVDVVVALGVIEQGDLDQAITAHGRILHDATVASINVAQEGTLGVINWNDPTASSLSELVTELANMLGKELIDNQIATALLTGIVAETDRFSNEKTTPHTMSASSDLMAAGANQQLVATKLQEPVVAPVLDDQDSVNSVAFDTPPQKNEDGTLEIDHKTAQSETQTDALPEFQLPDPVDSEETEAEEASDESQESEEEPQAELTNNPRLVMQAPALGGTLTANSQPEGLDPSTDPLTLLTQPPKLLDHTHATAETEVLAPEEPVQEPAPAPEPAPQPEPLPEPDNDEVAKILGLSSASASANPVKAENTEQPQTVSPPTAPTANFTPPPPSWTPPAPALSTPASASDANQTLSELEARVKSEEAASTEHLSDARDQVSEALGGAVTTNPEPIQALNAQPLGDSLHPVASQVDQTATIPELREAGAPELPTAPQVFDPNAPPPVPPPIPFQFGTPPPKQQ